MDAGNPIETYYTVDYIPSGCRCRLGTFTTHELAENCAKETTFNVSITKHVVFKTLEEAEEQAAKHPHSHVYPQYSYCYGGLWRYSIRV